MKWFKHDSDANMDGKLQEILLDYGLEGYGLYWYCIELITNKIETDNITFELEHDARVIARNTGSTVQKVEEMMKRFIDLGLFESTGGVVTCLKLAKRLDKSMTSNPNMRKFIEKIRDSHDSVMMNSDDIRKSHARREEEEDKNRKEKEVSQQKPADDKDLQFAEYMLMTIRQDLPNFKQPNLEKWSNTLRLMRERDNRSEEEIAAIWQWVRNDSFWSSNVLSPEKLRKQFDQLLLKSREVNNGKFSNSSGAATITFNGTDF